MKQYCLIFFVALFMIAGKLKAQNVGIGTATPHNSAILDIQSSNKGISLPSMTSAQRKAINNPKPGLLVYDLDKNTIYMYDGGQWLALLFSASEGLVPPIARVASDGDVGDEFGFSVSINGSYAVIGAPFDNVGQNVDQGAAYVFVRSGSVWSEQAKIIADDGATGDYFGYSVAINGSYIIVGAFLDNNPVTDAGSAYVFTRSGTVWTQQAKLTASNAATNDHFGYSVSISGAYAVIGAKDDDIGANVDEGSAYFFNRSGSVWSQQDNVVAPFGAAGDRFGISVSIDGDYAVIGASEDNVGADTVVGSAHVFTRNGMNWDYQDELVSPFPGDDDRFGESVAIDGNYIIVGEPYTSSYAGATAYIFVRSGSAWSHQVTLFAHPPVGAALNRFGISVAINGDYVIIGATETTINGNLDQGSAYLFKRDGVNWIFVRQILDTAGEPGHLLGRSVSVSGFNCIAGAIGANAFKGKILLLNFE